MEQKNQVSEHQKRMEPATPVAELLGTVMAAALLLRYRKRYGY